jgi:hypothetical protein
LLPNFNISLDWEPPSEYDESADEEEEGPDVGVEEFESEEAALEAVIVSYRIKSYHIISFHIVLYRIVGQGGD